MKLNLGCGMDYRYDRSWVNLDITPPASVIGNINNGGLPFRDRAFSLIWASHILEHITDLRMIQRELARVIKTGGILNIIVPYYLSPDAWGDPTHCRAFSEQSFMSVYWVGFSPIGMELKEYIKHGTGQKCTWLHVELQRTAIDYWEVQAALSGNNFTKG